MKKLELSSEYFGRYCKKMLNQFLFISSKMLNYKLQFLHGMVENTAFYHCGHFQTLQCISKWGSGDFSVLGKYDLFDLFNMYCKV